MLAKGTPVEKAANSISEIISKDFSKKSYDVHLYGKQDM